MGSPLAPSQQSTSTHRQPRFRALKNKDKYNLSFIIDSVLVHRKVKNTMAMNISFIFFFFFFLRLLLQWIICLRVTLFLVSSTVTPTLYMSVTTSLNFLWGLPVFPLPSRSIIIILCLIYPPSLLCTCPNYFSLASLTLSRPCDVLISNPANSATSTLASWLLVSATVSKHVL